MMMDRSRFSLQPRRSLFGLSRKVLPPDFPNIILMDKVLVLRDEVRNLNLEKVLDIVFCSKLVEFHTDFV